ncbi:hypothetical protein EJ08DRAFT_691480 [Tothia fuscella]|uniref:Helix-turn-helix domain-containing protein n=1 Tax=Tothia fuscella TaxID=1048955 RepID=A0A9P4U3S5_9PEZI|nr:hypothetical protein EJ08DRAFT_691480 [Tothia fuscella]
MGSSASKAGRAAAGNATRKYPTRPSPQTQTQAPASQVQSQTRAPPEQAGPTVHPSTGPSEVKDDAINLDASDPQYASNLHKLGIVNPQTQFSHPSDPQRQSQSQGQSQSQSQSPSAQSPIASSPTAHAPDFYSPPTSNPTSNHPFQDQYSMNPSSNPALLILKARQELQDKADREADMVGRRGFEGKEFVEVHLVREALRMRGERVEDAVIERKLGLKGGVVRRLGGRGVVEVA